MKTCVIDIGGGMRDVFGAGVFDFLMDEGFYSFDFSIGVSAGAANICTYIAGQRGREKRFYLVYSKRKEYMSIRNYITKKNYLDLDYIYHTLSNPGMEDPFDYNAFEDNKMDTYIVATNAENGESVYFKKNEVKEGNLKILMASSALPVLCRPVEINRSLYFDGGISDPIPFEKAFELGAEKIVLIITRPISYRRDGKRDKIFASILKKEFPNAAKALLERKDKYNRQLDQVEKLQKEKKIRVIYPNNLFNVSTTKRSDEDITLLYNHGYEKGKEIINYLE